MSYVSGRSVGWRCPPRLKFILYSPNRNKKKSGQIEGNISQLIDGKIDDVNLMEMYTIRVGSVIVFGIQLTFSGYPTEY